ncbi:MAG: hypothetical protein RL380_1464, partial [Verrucomicrobiota bacterium]
MADPLFLGIEGGGTRTVALLADAYGQLVKRVEAGPANLRLLTDAQLLKHFRALAKNFPRPTALGIGLAGVRTEADRQRIISMASKVWPRVPCVATDDLETALAAAPLAIAQAVPRILVLSGTGSCCFGKNADGKTAKAGGWGHVLGDGGSAYQIAMIALQWSVSGIDRGGGLPPLGGRLLRALQLNEPTEFIAWAQAASKTEIAALAVEVFAAAWRGDGLARNVLKMSALDLVGDASACARSLGAKRSAVEFIFAGSNLLKQPGYARLVAAQLKHAWPGARITSLMCESAWGAVELAKAQSPKSQVPNPKSVGLNAVKLVGPALSPTELRNPRSRKLDKLTTAQAVELMISEDAKIPAALRTERKQIERAVEFIVRAFQRGGKLFYVGAGTSGRLGILDASECPPTFRTPPELVQGIIAGGQRAIWSAVEGAEDDAAAGARAIDFRGVGKRDVV